MRRRGDRWPSMESLEARHLLAGESVVISEFMASNTAHLRDEFREYNDWIEIYNASEQPVNLAGWRLTDDPQNPDLWRFPEITLPAGEFLVVFASGHDQSAVDAELHTNFRLSAAGDYLGLVRSDGSVAHAYAPQFPDQYSDVSYGLLFDGAVPQFGQHRYFVEPTPGQLNGPSTITGRASEVTASVQRGFFDQSFDVTLATKDPATTIRYTTDGSAPTQEQGILYTQPIPITTTTTLRATAFRDDALPSESVTQTYIFLRDVLQQDGAGLPELWGYYDDQGPPRPNRAPANYAVDPDVVNHPAYRDTILEDLRSVPTLSLVLDPEDVWDFDNGIYSNPERRGDAWERAVSMEWIEEDGTTLVHANAGLEVHGGWARRFTYNSKLSFRMSFQSQYGDSTLSVPLFGPTGQTEFQQLVLRSGFNDSWQSGDRRNTYMQDQWTRQAQRELGGMAPRDRYVHLYLNGLYWGVYSVTERPDAQWAASNQGGEAEEYDVINTGGNVVDGDSRAWTDLSRAIARTPVDFAAVEELLDIDDFIDYMIVNQYVGNWDWPHNNWFASRRRVEGAKWHFHSWDAEAAFQDGVTANRVNPNNVTSSVGPSNIYRALVNVPEFQQRYADRIYLHLFGDGALTPQANIDRLNEIAAQIDRAIVGESARWGDGRVDQVNPPLTRDSTWVPRVTSINEQYFPARGERLVDQFRDANLYSTVAPPQFEPDGGHITPQTELQMTAAEGDILFTVDGTDPRLPGGAIRESARSFNSQSLVSGSSATRWWVPSGQAAEAGWQELSFDDQHWNEGWASFGFESGLVDDPLEMQRGFRVREHQSSQELQSLDDADRVIAGENRLGYQLFTRVPVINYVQGGRGGVFGDDQPFPNGGTSNFVLEVWGTLLVHEAGTYTFGVSSNDGARLELDDEVLFADTERHGASDLRFVSVELTEGSHDLRLVMFERLGTAVLEFFYAPGVKTEFDQDFRLVNDLQHRSYEDLLRTDLTDQLAGQGTSVYARMPFTVSDLDAIEQLTLRAKYDDGFVAYLNGVEVVRRAAPADLSFASRATAARPDTEAIQVDVFEISNFRELLREGENVLAVQVLNADVDDPDLLFSARLVGHFPVRPLHLTQSTTVKARVFLDEQWSPLAEADYRISIPARPEDVRVSEVHFHPRSPDAREVAAGFTDADDFEFLEIVNVGDTPIDLSGVRFVTQTIDGEEEGVSFDFSSSAVRELAPDERLVIVEDLEAFAFRYGSEVPVAGQWQGKLSNSAETITLWVGDQLAQQFRYVDGWYPIADGDGPSLEFVSLRDAVLEDWNEPANWRPSIPDGTPGRPRLDRPGDANRDGIFSSADLVQVMQAGEYEDGIAGNSTWEEGDWNGDGEFDTRDLVMALIEGWYR